MNKLPTSMQDFFFKPRRERLDWRLFSSIDVNSLIKSTDISLLQQSIVNLTYCDIVSEGTTSLTIDLKFAEIIKLFQLSQLTVEYLLFSQDYLIQNRETLRNDVQELGDKFTSCESAKNNLEKQVESLNKELKHIKKTLNVYQIMQKVQTNNPPMAQSSFHVRISL